MKSLYVIRNTVSDMIHLRLLLVFIGLFPVTCFAQKRTTAVKAIEQSNVVLDFTPVVDGKPFFLDSVYTSPGGDRYKITNWKFFVSNIALSSSLGKEHAAFSETKPAVLLIDFSKANHQILQVDIGEYTDIRLDVGLPRQINHTDPTSALPPLDLAQQDMYWEWNSGYIFLLIEGQLLHDQKDRFHFAIGGDNKIMPFAHGNLFNAVPLVKVEKGKTTTLRFTFDFNKLLKNGDGSNYSLTAEKARIVHGGYFADVLSMNAKQAMEFKKVEMRK